MAEREFLTVLLGLGILAWFSLQYRRQPHLAEIRLPLLGFALIVLGWVANAFDHAGSHWMRIVEHGFYALGAITYVIWTTRLKRGESKWVG